MVGGDELVTVKSLNGTEKKIPIREACLVFTPEKRRGDNGVMLPEFRGLGDLRELWGKFVTLGFTTDTALYPLGTPLFQEYPLIHLETTLHMIHGAKTENWKKY